MTRPRTSGRRKKGGDSPRTKRTHLCQPREIDEGKVEHVGTIYAEVDGKLADALVLAGDAEGLLLDLLADVVKVGVAPVEVEELAPLGAVARGVGRGGVDQLEHERAAGDDALAAREEVAADDAARGWAARW